MLNVPIFLSMICVFGQFAGTAAAGAAVRRSRTVSHHSRRQNDGSGKSWKEVDRYEGQSFLDGWDFYDKDDPTNGLVNYQNAENAKSKGLAVVTEDNVVILSVDDTTKLQNAGDKRDSISTKKTYDGGLFIADFAAMPFGCSVWPAYWSLGDGTWPEAGEIDILEGVNEQTTNQYTLHTAAGCSADENVKVSGQRGKTTNCASSGSDNTGCAFVDTDARSYGSGFNAAGGGVYAHVWDHTGITIWHFARNQIPENIKQKNPNPSDPSWGQPAAQFPSSNACDVGKYFQKHRLIIDTTLCGDWAGNAFQGCPGTCQETVLDPTKFTNAKWKINYIAVYELS